jgi:hypothetical protein
MLCYLGFGLPKNTQLFFWIIFLISLFFALSGITQTYQHYYLPLKVEERLREKKLIDYCPLSVPLEKC